MSRAARMLVIGMVGALGLGSLARPASATIWTPIASGTTDDVTAIEYQGGDRFWFTTANGIYHRSDGSFARTQSAPGAGFRDIEFAGDVGVAVGNAGAIFRSTNGGASWSQLPRPIGGSATDPNNCAASEPLGNIDSVRFDGQGNPWVFAGGTQIFKWNGSGFAWANAAVPCPLADEIDDAFFVPGSAAGYFVGDTGRTWFSNTPLAAMQGPKASAGSGAGVRRRVTGDPANPLRQWAVMPIDGSGFYFQRSTDGWNSHQGWTLANQAARECTTTNDLDYAGGTTMAVGLAGEILQSTDGASFFFNDADGGDAATDWFAVSVANAANAAVGGRGGKLVTTTKAANLPEQVKPSGTISGPSKTSVGKPATFTASLSDTGGSGINPAKTTWSVAGVGTRAGAKATFRFPKRGTYTVTLSFADNAGNRNAVTKQVVVRAAQLPVSFRGRGNTLSAKIRGSRVIVTIKGTLKRPRGPSAKAACGGKLKLQLRKGARTLASGTAKLRLRNGTCRFAKTMSVSRAKVGSAKTLKLRLSHPGNRVRPAAFRDVRITIRR